jgi:hypothetical protein
MRLGVKMIMVTLQYKERLRLPKLVKEMMLVLSKKLVAIPMIINVLEHVLKLYS